MGILPASSSKQDACTTHNFHESFRTAIEVIVTSGDVSKLEIYRRLGVTEVWFWKQNQLFLYHLRDNSLQETASVFPNTHGYEQITTSELLPELDVLLLERCLLITDSIQAVDEFEQGL